MSENKESILKVIENKKTVTGQEQTVQKSVSGHSNPLAKKFIEFHNDKNKLKVKDLFKK